ncbi:MAG: hypothetical protein HKN25_14755 [Pyrinomonadaceae bacterium]|nr:hypothetical protein [Pyrinomonadaceae bacterium]
MIYTSSIGLFHLIVSILALIFGTWVIATEKGTAIHKKIGYLYAACMTAVIVTSFMMYRLFGGFGIFHVAAVISAISLLGGMVPVILRKPKKSWLSLHFSFMFWSVMGLYAAFAAEIFTRIPRMRFFWMVGVATLLVMVAANIAFVVYKKRWEKLESVYIEGK